MLRVRGDGFYTVLVHDGSLWIFNSSNGAVAGPFDANDVENGVFALTGCGKPTFGEVIFVDETILPGRVRFIQGEVEYDVMPFGVSVNGKKHTWNMPDCP